MIKALNVNAYQNQFGEVDLIVHTRAEGAKAADIDTMGYSMSYADAWLLYENLGTSLRHLADERMRNVAAGDCATCGNYRMVDVVVHKGSIAERKEHQHCPDCHGRYADASPAYPVSSNA